MKSEIRILILLFSFITTMSNAQVTLKKFDVRCHGGTSGKIEVEVKTNGGKVKSYQWEDGDKSPRRIGLKEGKYCVTVTDESGCTDSGCALINEPPKIQILVSATVIPPTTCGSRGQINYSSVAVGGNGEATVYPELSTVTKNEGVAVFTATDSSGCKERRFIAYTNAEKRCSYDPNDIQGPIGVGEEKFISIHDTSNYRIRVENDAELASSPANLIIVSLPIPPEANLESFRLGNFGFANLDFSPPDNVAFYQTTLMLANELGVNVQVTAGLDVSSMKAFWQLRAVDAITGVPNLNPNLGILPINDETTIGEGYFDFTISPFDTLVTGDTLALEAEIVFDQNDAIATNLWNNTIDAFAPITTISPLLDTIYGNSLDIFWTAADDLNGSGYAKTQIWVAENNDQFFLVTERTDGQFTYKNTLDDYVKMFIVSIDSVGNVEIPTDTFDLFFSPEPSLKFITTDQDEYCLNDTIIIDASISIANDFDLSVKRNNQADSLLISSNSPANLPYNFIVTSEFINDTLTFLLSSPTNSNLHDTLIVEVYGLPEVIASEDVITCNQDYPFVIAEGANSYKWSPGILMGDSLEAVTRVYFQTDGVAYVVGTDLHGCSNFDSVQINYLPTYIDTIDVELCSGDSLLVNGAYVYSAGFYPEQYSTIEGCDSTIIYNAFILNPCIWDQGNIIYVDQDASGANNGTSWQDAFIELYDGLYVANKYEDVDSVWVAEGSYYPNSSQRNNALTLQNGTKLFGGFDGAESQFVDRNTDSTLVILSGNIGLVTDSLDNTYHVILVDESCIDCELNMLSIQEGVANGTQIENASGGGVYSKGVVNFLNVKIHSNTASQSGGGIFISGSSAEAILKDCTFGQNNAPLEGDVLVIDGATLKIIGLVKIDK